MMDQNYVKKFKRIALHEGINIKDPYAFIDDVEAELAEILESALESEEKAIAVLENEQEEFTIPFSVKRIFDRDHSLIIHGRIVKDQKKYGNKELTCFCNQYDRIGFIVNGHYTERKFIYND